jgi:hypothetical protein
MTAVDHWNDPYAFPVLADTPSASAQSPEIAGVKPGGSLARAVHSFALRITRAWRLS